ncbi:MAG: GNAT family protein [Candidatus Berkelbacteria bacterium]|nr:GNAT family protein [Candidatus Berkelbacteria bacterium]
MLKTATMCLRPVVDDDYPFLFQIRNDLENLHLWSVRRHALLDLESFAIEFERDMQSDKHVFLIIEKHGQPIGFVFSYSPQFIDQYCCVTIYLIPQKRLVGMGPLALGMFLCYLFETFNFYKIYCDVYSYNTISVNTLKRFRAELEGAFREHRFYSGKRHDLLRFAIYSDQQESIRSHIERILRRK